MSFIAVGSVMINALGQSATTRLARSFRSGDWPDFRRLALRLCALAVGIGLTGAIIAAIGGSYFLNRVYRPELAAISTIAGAGTPRRNDWIRRRDARVLSSAALAGSQNSCRF